MKDDKYFGKICVFVSLVTLLIFRLFLDGDSSWIQLASYAGVLIALADLYSKIHKENWKKDKFKIIRGVAILLSICLMILLVMMLTFFNIGSKGNDILTIAALLISLPSDLYCIWAKNYTNS